MEIRSYKAYDLEEIVQLFYDTVHRVNISDYSQEQVDAWATGCVNLEEWHKSFCTHHTVVATDGSMITGFGDLDDSGYLDRLYVHHKHQRQGIATMICNKLESLVKPDVSILTYASITARPFFEKRGYKVVKEQYVERDGILLKNYEMCKRR